MERLKVLIVGLFGVISVEVAKVVPLAELTPEHFKIPEIGENEVKNIIQIIIGVITIVQLLIRNRKNKPKDDNE